MTTLAFRHNESIFGGLDIPTAGTEGRSLAANFLAEIRRLRELGARNSGAFHDLESLAREHGVAVQESDVFTFAQRFLLVLPGDLPAAELDVDNDGDVVFDWSGPGGRMMTLALRYDGRISFAARLSSTKSRNGNDLFLDSIPQEIISLLREVTQR